MNEERAERAGVAYQFEEQANKLYLQIVSRLTNFRYVLKDELSGDEITAVVIARSFDYYEKKLGRSHWKANLLIVQHHNAVLPIRAICLEDSSVYEAGTAPVQQRAEAKRNNHEESILLISKLILGVDAPELSKLSKRSQKRYLVLRNKYLRAKRRGRPQKRESEIAS